MEVYVLDDRVLPRVWPNLLVWMGRRSRKGCLEVGGTVGCG